MSDTIYRQDAIDAITAQKGVVDKSVAKRVLYQLPSAHPEQGDKVVFWKKRAKEYENMISVLVAEQTKGIKLDSIEITGEGIKFKKSKPERTKGKWMFYERREPQYDLVGTKTWANAYRCSECGFLHTVIEDFGHYLYCPSCGAYMREETEDGRSNTVED